MVCAVGRRTWVWPLLAAGLLIAPLPPQKGGAIRAASIVVLGVAATLSLGATRELLAFVVAVMGRFPIVTPSAVFPRCWRWPAR